MNKILKFLSILVIGFVMFSCSTPTDDPVEETPEVPTYSVIFTTKDEKSDTKNAVEYLNSLPEFKNLEKGTEVSLYEYLYCNEACNEFTTKIVETSVYKYYFYYDNENPGIDSVVIGNEDVEVELIYKECTDLNNKDL